MVWLASGTEWYPATHKSNRHFVLCVRIHFDDWNIKITRGCGRHQKELFCELFCFPAAVRLFSNKASRWTVGGSDSLFYLVSNRQTHTLWCECWLLQLRLCQQELSVSRDDLPCCCCCCCCGGCCCGGCSRCCCCAALLDWVCSSVSKLSRMLPLPLPVATELPDTPGTEMITQMDTHDWQPWVDSPPLFFEEKLLQTCVKHLCYFKTDSQCELLLLLLVPGCCSPGE